MNQQLEHRLRRVLVEGLELSGDEAETALSEITEWLDKEDRPDRISVRTGNKLVLVKAKDGSLDLTSTEATNAAGASIVEPDHNVKRAVGFPLEPDSE